MNHSVLAHWKPKQIKVEICRADEREGHCGLSSEFDEMWSDVGRKAPLRWLWHAIDHHTGQVLAYVFGRRKARVFLRLQVLLESFGITRYDTAGWGIYERHVDTEKHIVGVAGVIAGKFRVRR